MSAFEMATPAELAAADAAILTAAERWERMMWTRDSPAARVEAEAALLEDWARRTGTFGGA